MATDLGPRPTRTLAEIYEKQGLFGRAREIWRKLAEGDDPEAARVARDKLSALPSAERRIALLEALLERVRGARRGG